MSKSSTPKLMLIGAASLLVCVNASKAGPPAAAPATAVQPAAAAPVPNPAVALTKEQSSRFQDALTSLAAQAHIAIAAEGAPLHPRLVGAAIPNITTPRPVGQALTTLGAAYDYDVQRCEGGVFILTKRYSNPRDLPCVTLPECQASLQDVSQILDKFSPHFRQPVYTLEHDDQRDTVISLFNSLSPAQLAAAQANTLRYGDLLPDQQTLIWNFIMYGFIQIPLDRTQTQINDLTQAPHIMLTARNEDKQAGVYREVPGYNGAPKFLMPLPGQTSGYPIDAAGKRIMEPPPEWLAVAPVVLVGAAKPLTLAEAVASLPPIHKQQAVVDKPVQAKPVTVAGLTNADPMKVLEAFKTLYGLRIGASDKSAPMLMRQAPMIPDKISAIAAAIWQALPASYTRALDADARPKAAPIPASPWMPPPNIYALQMEEQARLREAVEENQHEAIRRLRIAMQSQIRLRGPDARIPVSSLSEADRSALAVAMMSDPMLTLRDAYSGTGAREVIHYLDKLDDMIVSTVPSELAHQNGLALPSLYLNIHQNTPGESEIVCMGGQRYFDIPNGT